jgi:hypothetical protein
VELELLRDPTDAPPLLVQRLDLGKLLLAQVMGSINVPVRKDGWREGLVSCANVIGCSYTAGCRPQRSRLPVQDRLDRRTKVTGQMPTVGNLDRM